MIYLISKLAFSLAVTCLLLAWHITRPVERRQPIVLIINVTLLYVIFLCSVFHVSLAILLIIMLVWMSSVQIVRKRYYRDVSVGKEEDDQTH